MGAHCDPFLVCSFSWVARAPRCRCFTIIKPWDNLEYFFILSVGEVIAWIWFDFCKWEVSQGELLVLASECCSEGKFPSILCFLVGREACVHLAGSDGCASQPRLTSQTAPSSSPGDRPSDCEGGVHLGFTACFFFFQFWGSSFQVPLHSWYGGDYYPPAALRAWAVAQEGFAHLNVEMIEIIIIPSVVYSLTPS